MSIVHSMSRAESSAMSIDSAERASPFTLSTVMDSSAWIIQGVPPVTDQCRMNDESDSIWYARTVNELLGDTIDDWEQPLDDIMFDVVCSVIDRYSSSVEDFDAIDLDTLPSAMITCIRWDGEGEDATVEYFNLGDCVVSFELGFDTCRICATDGSLHESDYDAKEQWRLSFSPESIKYARHGSLESHEIHGAHLYPTAVDAAAEVYEMFPDTDAFIDTIHRQDTEDIVTDIKQIYATQTHEHALSTRPGVQDVSLISLQF